MKEQQVQRYEQERYLTANLTRVAEVADALQLDLFAFFEAREDTLLDKIAPNLKGAIGFEATKLPVKEMKSRGWLKQVHTPAALPTPTDEELASAFVSQAFQSQLPPSLHKQHVRMGSEQDPYSLLAWKAKVLQKARRISVQLRGGRKPQTLDAHAITRLVGLSAVPDGPVKAVEALQEYGVILVFERHLPLTHLDGAAMLLDNDLPVIARVGVDVEVDVPGEEIDQQAHQRARLTGLNELWASNFGITNRYEMPMKSSRAGR